MKHLTAFPLFATFAAFTAFAVCSVGAETNVFALSSFSSSDVELVSNSQLSNGALQILNGGMAVYPNLVPLDSNWTVTFAFTIDYSTSGGFAFVVGDSSSFETAQPEEGYPDVPSSFSVQYVMGEDGTPSFENPALYHLNALFTTQPPVVYTWITYNPTTETLRCYVNTVPEMQQVPSMQADVVMTDYVTLTDGMAYVGFLGGFSTSGVQVEILSWSLDFDTERARPDRKHSNSDHIAVWGWASGGRRGWHRLWWPHGWHVGGGLRLRLPLRAPPPPGGHFEDPEHATE